MHPQSMFWIKNKKNSFTPANLRFNIKVGFKGLFIARARFPDVIGMILVSAYNFQLIHSVTL